MAMIMLRVKSDARDKAAELRALVQARAQSQIRSLGLLEGKAGNHEQKREQLRR